MKLEVLPPVTSNLDQGHWNWYEHVKLTRDSYHAKLVLTYSHWGKAHINVSETAAQLNSQHYTMIFMRTQNHHHKKTRHKTATAANRSIKLSHVFWAYWNIDRAQGRWHWLTEQTMMINILSVTHILLSYSLPALCWKLLRLIQATWQSVGGTTPH